MSAMAELLPSLSQLGALAAVAVVLVALSGLGALVGGLKRHSRAADLCAGWGVVTIAMTLAGLAVPGSLAIAGWACIGAGLLAAGGMGLRRGLLPAGLGWAALLMMPLALMVAAMEPSQWDEFSQWLYSSLYLFENGAFPALGGPAFDGSFASYPFANAFPGYLASLVAGRFLENAGALVNLFVCISFALVLAELIAEARGKPELAAHPGMVALALLAATIANPTFVPKVAFTAYADVPTAVSLALLGLGGWRMLVALEDGDRTGALRLSLQAGLAAAMLLSLKQANLVLFLLTLIGLGVVALRVAPLRRLHTLLFFGLIAVPALVPYLAWRGHVNANFPGSEFVVRPLAQWAIQLIPTILGGMAEVASNKGGHFGVMAVVLVLAVMALVRMRGRFDRLVVIAAAVALGYNAFLLFAYVTAFGEYEARIVASYWRYNMHVGDIAWACLLFGLAGWWRWPVHKAVGIVLPVLVAAAPVATVKLFRFDLRAPKQYVRAVGTDMRPLIPAGARLGLLDPTDSGFYILLMRYMLHGSQVEAERLSMMSPEREREVVPRWLSNYAFTHVWIHIPTPATRQVFGQALPDGASYLLARDATGWSVVKHWPYPGYANPHDIKD